MEKKKIRKSILLVEDNTTVGLIVSKLLEHITLDNFDLEVRWEKDPIKALEIIEDITELVDLVITDKDMPGVDGLEIIRAMLANRPETPIVGVSGDVLGFEQGIRADLGERCPHITIVNLERRFEHFNGDISLIAKPLERIYLKSLLLSVFG